MAPDPLPQLDAFVPVLVWPGRRPTLAELATWHEALRDSVASLMHVDLLACWLYPSRGGSVLLGPRSLAPDALDVPAAEPLVAQEGLFALEDRLASAGYRSAMVVPIRDEMQDVGLLAVGNFSPGAYTLAEHRSLHRVAALLATSCRRLAACAWITPRPARDERNAIIANVTEGLLDASDNARTGADLVQLISDALANQLPHDALELLSAAPAPECWALLGCDRGHATPPLSPITADAIAALVHYLGARDILRIDDVRTIDDGRWPGSRDVRGTERIRAVLAARMDVAGEFVGWLWFGSETVGWFKPDDESTARLAARLVASRVAAWGARMEMVSR